MHTVDYCVIVVYLIMMILIGIRCRNTSTNISDYIRMGNKSTWWLAGLSLFMAYFSAATFTGIAGQAFIAGWSVLFTQMFTALGFFIQAALMTSTLRRTRAITPMDAVRARFGTAAEQMKAYIGTLSSFFFAGYFLLGFGTFASSLLDMPLWIVVVGMGIVVVFYSVSGGSWSVQITDGLQALILIPVTVAFSILCLIEIGGFSGLFSEIRAAGLTSDFALIKAPDHQYSIDLPIRKGNFTQLWVIGSLFGAVIGAFHIQTCHRYLSLRDEKDARKAAILAGILTLCGCLIWYIPPIVGRLRFAEDITAVDNITNPADAAYAITAMKMLPPGLLGMIFVSMLSATMSSMDSFLTGTAGLIVRNIYQPLIRQLKRKVPSDKSLLTITKCVNLTLGLWGIVMAFVLNQLGGDTGMFQVMQTILTLIGSPTSAPFALALLYRKIPVWGLFAGVFSGIAMSTTFFYWRQQGITVEWGYETFAMSAACIIPTLLSSFFWKYTKPGFRDHVDRFFKLIRTPIDADQEVGERADYQLFGIIGNYALAMAALTLLLLFWCASPREILTVLGIASFLGITGGYMTFKGGQQKS